MSYDPLDAPNTTYLWARLLVEELVRNGIDTFFVAPGSRSTPLTVSAARHPEANVILHVDERGTAFAALGYGRAAQSPAAWITTSGTAVANGQPAVVEASVDGVPMLLLTADRPPELRDSGANQTIDQVKIFGDYVRWQADVPPPSAEVDPAYVLTTANQAVHQSRRISPGPVHLNCGYRKPLEPVGDGPDSTVPDAVERWAARSTPFTQYPAPEPEPSAAGMKALTSAIEGRACGLIVAGRLDREADVEATRQLAVRLGWPLLPDVTSRLRLGPESQAARIAFGDLVLTSESFQASHAPNAVIQVGGRFASKRLRLFLRDAQPNVWAVVRPTPSRIDPDHRITHHVESRVAPFLEQVAAQAGAVPESAGWRSAWREANEQAAAVVAGAARDDALTEPTVATLLSRHVPPDHAIVAASSMPVRDLNRHASTQGPAVPVYANRGASGIDGTVATAAGISVARDGPVTLLIGDLALWHDLNSLALLKDRPVVVVVLNNDGGGIFHFLPIEEHEDVFEPYFTTPQNRTFDSVANTFDLSHSRPGTPAAFVEAYRDARDALGPALIEVRTDREHNQQVHEQIEVAVAEAIEGEGDSS
jgi:2-succinyl-5-enolpyruvyl-6-hydroxy-3-cyclohexene-1-carboxylate synthase